MFSIFGKRRTAEEPDRPPIQSARPEDGYVMIDPSPNIGGMYPNIGGTDTTAGPVRLAPMPPPTEPKVNISDTFHYMQGVPFQLCKEFQMASSKDTFAIEIGDLLAFVTNRMNINNYEYDFSVEKSVMKEYS